MAKKKRAPAKEAELKVVNEPVVDIFEEPKAPEAPSAVVANESLPSGDVGAPVRGDKDTRPKRDKVLVGHDPITKEPVYV